MRNFDSRTAFRPYDGMRKTLLTMKITFMLTVLSVLNLNAATGQIKETISLGKTRMTLEEAFNTITKQSNYDIFYNYDELDVKRMVEFPAANMDVDALLKAALGSRHTYQITGSTIVISASPQRQPQRPASTRITGKVTDNKGNPLTGVQVALKLSKYITITDAKGAYGLNFPATDKAVVVFSMVGMRNEEVIYTGQATINVKMQERVQDVSEVVVTGYGDVSRRNQTSASSSISVEEIDVPGLNTLDMMLEGRIPGLFVNQNSGQPGVAARMRVRGTSTIVGNQAPLIVIDGVIQTDPVNIDPNSVNDLDFVNRLGNAITGINPGDIERIDVLKDAAATALYGARSANGVIVLTTKKGNSGPPTVGYRFDGTFSLRPRYTDCGFNMMNSAQRVDLARELIEKGTGYASDGYTDDLSWPGYEGAYLNHFKYGNTSFEEYQARTRYYETLNTDWLDILTRDAFSQAHSVNISGGSETTRYYISLGYNDEQGNIKGEENKRYSTNLRVSNNHKKLSTQVGVMANMSRKNYVSPELNIMNYATTMSRAIGLYNADGSLWFQPRTSTYAGNQPFNIKHEKDNSSMDIDQNSVSLNANIQYKMTEHLRAQLVGSYQYSNTDQEEWFGEDSFHSRNLHAGGSGASSTLPFGGVLKANNTKNNSYTLRAQLDYSSYLGLAQKHFINAMVCGDISSSDYLGKVLEHRGYYKDRGRTFPDYSDLAANTLSNYSAFLIWLAKNGNPAYSESLTNMASLVATATYAYDERYIINFNTRSDWSNAFGNRSNEKFMPIWSISGRWNIDKDLLERVEWVDLLALRLSYGLQGNMHTDQPTQMSITRGKYNSTFDYFTSTVKSYPNPDLEWEQTNSYNVGVDFSFWGNKFSGQLQYYYKKTTNALLSKRVATINGVSSYVVNAGDVENQGVEVSFNFKPINQGISANGKRGWVWRIDPQIGQALNKLLNQKINRNNKLLQDELTLDDLLSGRAYVAGKPLNTFFSFRYNGLSNLGHPTFKGLETENKDELKAKYDEVGKEDKKEVWWLLLAESGRREATLQGGISNYLAYRNISFSFNLSYSLGSKIRLLPLTGAYGAVTPKPHENVRAEFVNRWRHPGDEKFTDIPVAGPVTDYNTLQGWWANAAWRPLQASNNTPPTIFSMYNNSDLRVASGNYLKVQSAVLRYTFNERLLNRIGLSHADVALAGTNLLMLCSSKLKGQDPTQSGSSGTVNLTPRPSFSLSVNVNF